jgi:hypothetical protein
MSFKRDSDLKSPRNSGVLFYSQMLLNQFEIVVENKKKGIIMVTTQTYHKETL